MQRIQRLGCFLLAATTLFAAQPNDVQRAADAILSRVSDGEVDPDELSRLASVLGDDTRVAASTVKNLIPLTRHDDDMVRTAAVDALGALGSRSPAAVDALAELLGTDNARSRGQAAELLEQLNIAPSSVLQAAVALGSPYPKVRFQAARFLGQFGPRASIARAALVQLALDDATHVSVRWEAIASLRAIGKDSAISLAKVARSSEKGVTYKAIEALTHLGPEAAEAVPDLRALVEHHDARVRVRAVRGLAAIGPAAVESRPELIQAKSDVDPDVRQAASEALQAIIMP